MSIVQKMRDLGITIYDKLTLSQHVSNIVSTARIRAYLVFKLEIDVSGCTLLRRFITRQTTARVYLSGVVGIHGNRNRPSQSLLCAAIIFKRLPGLNNLTYALKDCLFLI